MHNVSFKDLQRSNNQFGKMHLQTEWDHVNTSWSLFYTDEALDYIVDKVPDTICYVPLINNHAVTDNQILEINKLITTGINVACIIIDCYFDHEENINTIIGYGYILRRHKTILTPVIIHFDGGYTEKETKDKINDFISKMYNRVEKEFKDSNLHSVNSENIDVLAITVRNKGILSADF